MLAIYPFMARHYLGRLPEEADMPGPSKAGLRRLWLNIHLWLGIGLAVLLVPIGLSGSLLVWHDHLDAAVAPSRYAATSGPMLPASALMDAASEKAGSEFRPWIVRFPESAGWPVVVSVREARAERGVRPRVLAVYLDPPTGRVLDVVNFRVSLIGFLHRFHENLTIPEYSGRAIVGWAGVAMLILSLTGIYLWWPRNCRFLLGLRWRRGPTLSLNLHHLFGFWIAIPLTVVSATGIYLGFPQQARDLLSRVAPLTPQQRGGFNVPLLRTVNLTPDAALLAALNAEPGSQAAAIFAPTQQNNAWRIQLRTPDTAAVTTIMVDDKSGAASKMAQLGGDRIALWIRWIHEGSHSGTIWQAIVFICGLLPTLFTITGVLIWLRSRRIRRSTAGGGRAAGGPQLDAAE
jgi:uncharacterized iron-regulated membrane protein